MNKQGKDGIGWCDYTWNPVSGCLHPCRNTYCYANKQVRRFSTVTAKPAGEIHDLKKRADTVYPFGFDPTFHRYKLGEPSGRKTPATIFVVSMGDLFGEWVPDKWIKTVFAECAAAPQHRYMFLTKNPKRYIELAEKGLLPEADNMWYGSTATTPDDTFWWSDYHNCFISIEPLLAEFSVVESPLKDIDWVIIGAETGTRSGKVKPRREWAANIV